jgi:cell fate regulator YaaT (PSP1 superfamily)
LDTAIEIVGVRFKPADLIYYFNNQKGIELKVRETVVAESKRGLQIGRVVIPPKWVTTEDFSEPLEPILRKATAEDFRQSETARLRGKDALKKCAEIVDKHQLPMKLLSAEYNLDESYLTFYFKAEKRVDFRSLLRNLIATFGTRIELWQVNVRDEAKILGDIGRCGRPLCCTTYLSKFNPISMKMAREQSLPLNPDRISGICGRLLCCLNYEEAYYSEMREKMPQVGQIISTSQGTAKVIRCDLFREMVIVETEGSKTSREVPLVEIESHNKVRR